MQSDLENAPQSSVSEWLNTEEGTNTSLASFTVRKPGYESQCLQSMSRYLGTRAQLEMSLSFKIEAFTDRLRLSRALRTHFLLDKAIKKR